MTMITVASLFVYPLKGGRGIELERVDLDTFGPRNDRRWMVVDRDGALVTQREIPKLCRMGAVPDPRSALFTAPDMPDLVIGRPFPGAATRPVRIWSDVVMAVDLGEEPATWCSEFLGGEVRLVYFPDDGKRRTDPRHDPVGARVSFADGYPLLVIGAESLIDLNTRLTIPLPMNRFRPNVVTIGAPPFAEDAWSAFAIGSVPFEGVKLCDRCPVTTTDQLTGERGKEPLRTLATFRKRPGGVMFGLNVIHRATGTIRVGDPVRVLRGGEPGLASSA